MPTGIAWTDETWNPAVGCSRVSTGCENCYAEKTAHRMASFPHTRERYAGTTTWTHGKKGARWTGKVNLVPQILDRPLCWKKPRLIFVNSMSDLFHEAIPFEYISAVFGVMGAAPQHTFQILTKRPARMLEWFRYISTDPFRDEACVVPRELGQRVRRRCSYAAEAFPNTQATLRAKRLLDDWTAGVWPLPNVHLYVSTENQKTFDERVPLLAQCPAAVRGISAEPLLGPIDMSTPLRIQEDLIPAPRELALFAMEVLDHVIVGGESGRGARVCDRAWIRSILHQCWAEEERVPAFVKQMGWNAIDSDPERAERGLGRKLTFSHPKGGDLDEWPSEFQVQEPARARTE